MVGESFMQHNVEPHEEEQPAGIEDMDQKNLSSREIAELQA